MPGDVSTWGYVWFNKRGTSGAALPAAFPARTPPLQYLSTLNVKSRASNTVLAADVVVTDSLAAPYNYSPKTATIPFGTSHAPSSVFYANVLYVDGHVSAVRFEAAKATPIPQPGGGIFWIPDAP